MDKERFAELMRTSEHHPKPIFARKSMIFEVRTHQEPTEEQRREADEIGKRQEERIDRVHMERKQWDPGIDAIRLTPINKGFN